MSAPQYWLEDFTPGRRFAGTAHVLDHAAFTLFAQLTGDAHREGQLLMGNISTVQFGNGQAVLAIIFAAGILASAIQSPQNL